MLLAAALLGSLGAVELRWESVAGCPDAAVVDRQLDALLGAAPREGAAVTGRLRAEAGAAYVLHLEIALAGRREARELRASDCGVLARAGVLVVAVTLDALATAAAVDAPVVSGPAGLDGRVPPPAVAGAPPPRRPRARAAAEPGVVEPPSFGAGSSSPRDATLVDPFSSSSRPPRPPQGLTLAASAGASQGMTPGIAGGIEGQLGWRRGALRLLVGGFHWFSRRVDLRPDVGIESALSGGSVRACVAFERPRLEVPLCAGVDVAAMHGGGVGATVRRRPASDSWVGVAAGVGLAYWPTRRLALQARVEGVLGAWRPGMFLSIDGQRQEAFRMPPVGVRLLVGPMVRLW